MRLVFRYLVWMVKLTSFLLRFKMKGRAITFFAIDFDAALPCYVASIFRSDVRYVYDIHDEFAIRYRFPRVVRGLIQKIDQVVRRNSIVAIHVDASRVNPKDENYLVIENITPDVYSTLGIVPQYTLRKFVVSGLLCEQRA